MMKTRCKTMQCNEDTDKTVCRSDESELLFIAFIDVSYWPPQPRTVTKCLVFPYIALPICTAVHQ